MTSARVAVGFLTRIPVGGRMLAPGELSRAAVFFPAVGLVVGGVAALVRWGAGLVLDAGPATVLALVAAVIVTGGLHEDGLADTADGLGAHTTRERRLEIMRDSRVGTFGALAVAFALLFAFALLAPLDAEDFARAAICGHVLGRWSALPQAALLPRARGGGAGADVEVGPVALAIGTAYTAAIVLAVGGPGAGAVALGAAAVAGLACGLGLRRVLGGVTGDTFGAVNKVTELAAYAAVAGMWGA